LVAVDFGAWAASINWSGFWALVRDVVAQAIAALIGIVGAFWIAKVMFDADLKERRKDDAARLDQRRAEDRQETINNLFLTHSELLLDIEYLEGVGGFTPLRRFYLDKTMLQFSRINRDMGERLNSASIAIDSYNSAIANPNLNSSDKQMAAIQAAKLLKVIAGQTDRWLRAQPWEFAPTLEPQERENAAG
jgi:hypothetical protein